MVVAVGRWSLAQIWLYSILDKFCKTSISRLHAYCLYTYL